MRIKISDPLFFWHEPFRDQEFDVLMDAYDPNHHQYPVMTKAGRTWFHKEACEIIQP